MKSNTRFDQNKRGIECLNCKQPISNIDNFCSNCGQVNDLKPLSIKQYLTEFLSGFFSFDTRTLNTITPLIFRPGKVTNEYIHGERMKYVNPFQLYLHTSIVFFLITGVFSSIDSYKNIADNYKKGEVSEQKKDSLLNEAKKEVNKGIEEVKNKLNKNNISLPNINEIIDKENSIQLIGESEIKKQIIKNSGSLFISKKFRDAVNDTLLSHEEKDKIINNLIINNVSNLYGKLVSNDTIKTDLLNDFQNFKTIYITNLEEKLVEHKIDYKISEKAKTHTENLDVSGFLGKSFYNKISHFQASKTKNAGRALDSLGYKRTTTNVFWFKKVKEVKTLMSNKEARRTFANNAISKIGIVLFIMLPVFALFMKLFYIRRKINYTEHLIFIFHTQTVFFFFLLLEIIIERTFKTSIGIPVFIILFLTYLFIALRNFYKQSKWKTFFKFILLNMTYFFLTIIGVVIVGFLAFLI